MILNTINVNIDIKWFYILYTDIHILILNSHLNINLKMNTMLKIIFQKLKIITKYLQSYNILNLG